MDRKLIALLAGGVIVMGLTAWLFYSPRPPTIPLSQRRYLYCPNCLRELPYTEKADGEECKRCGPDHTMVATKESIKDTGGPPSPFARVLVPVLIEFNLLLGVVVWYVLARRNANPEDEDYLHTDCDHCTQRLRYRKQKAGAVGQCPRCKYSLIFPLDLPDPHDRVARWWHPGEWPALLKRLWGRLRARA